MSLKIVVLVPALFILVSSISWITKKHVQNWFPDSRLRLTKTSEFTSVRILINGFYRNWSCLHRKITSDKTGTHHIQQKFNQNVRVQNENIRVHQLSNNLKPTRKAKLIAIIWNYNILSIASNVTCLKVKSNELYKEE